MNVAIFYIGEKIANTVWDHLMSFQLYGQNAYEYIDILKDTISFKEAEKYDAAIVHYTLSLFTDKRCPAWLRIILRNMRAKKIVFIQDEYRMVNHVIENLNFVKADVLYTCVPESEIEKVYPTEKLPALVKINTLTGFVPESLFSLSRSTYEERKLDVVYRARKLSAWYGRLGQEKWMIAEKFRSDAQRYNLAVDISYHEQDRIYGDKWIDFLKNAKSAIGCESGASVFDFTGEIQKKVEQYEKYHPDATFKAIEEKFFKGFDDQIKLNQISPRCFECAALGTLMILYEGEYSNILKPWRHYVPLKKDHSNMDEVVSVINSPEHWKRITQCTFEEIAMNEEYHYKGFIKKFEMDLYHLFKENISIEENAFIFFDLKSKFLSAKQPFRSPIMGFLKDTMKKVLGEKITHQLALFKRRVALSLYTFKNLCAEHECSRILYLYSLKKDFCEEYNAINSLKEYVSCIKEKCGFIPIAIKHNNNEKKTMIYFSDDLKYNQDFYFSLTRVSAQETCSVIIEDSWGVPQNIRGKNITLKYLKLFDNGSEL